MYFILTRFFAVSALVCGAARYAYAAPIAAPAADAGFVPAVLSSVETAASVIQELPVLPRAPERIIEYREAVPEASPERFDEVVSMIEELPIIPRAPERVLEDREATPEASPERVDGVETVEVDERAVTEEKKRTCYTYIICR